jgi:hypothetical protein
LNTLLYSWRKERGLDYHGWWQFLLKRWLRRNKLGFLVPFTYAVDDYDDGLQTLTVWRWGKKTVERYQWPHYRDVEILDRLRKRGMINRRQLYRVILAEARRI